LIKEEREAEVLIFLETARRKALAFLGLRFIPSILQMSIFAMFST